jgi:hypothetical protein
VVKVLKSMSTPTLGGRGQCARYLPGLRACFRKASYAVVLQGLVRSGAVGVGAPLMAARHHRGHVAATKVLQQDLHQERGLDKVTATERGHNNRDTTGSRAAT